MIINKISYADIKVQNQTKNKIHNTNQVSFQARLVPDTKLLPKVILPLIATGGTIVSGILTEDKNKMNNAEKFIQLRDEFGKQLEPLESNLERASWDFYINSNSETQECLEQAESEASNLYKNENLYKKFQTIDSSQLSKHEAEQLKDILKEFEKELNTGEMKKALQKKENEISQKYNTYIPQIDGKEVTKVDISNILQKETDVELRKKAYAAMMKGGELIASDLIELVKMRNEYAKTKGYENFFDYMIKEEYDIEPELLDKLMADIYSKAQIKINHLIEKRQKELKAKFNTENLQAYHWRLLSDSNPDKEVNSILSSYTDNEEQIIETIAKKMYAGMGYNIDKLVREGKLTLDLYPRKGKNTHGFCFGVEAGKDARILANLMNDVRSLQTLNHELGHCVYDLALPQDVTYIDKKPASNAMTEAIAMMMEDLIKKEDVLKEIAPSELIKKLKESHKEDEANFVSRCLLLIDFEKILYRNPQQNPEKLWADLKEKYSMRKETPDNEWATIPHYLSHPGYCQNYFRATLIKAQIYNFLVEKLGNITENTNTAEFLNKNIFALGATINEHDLIKQFTGKKFGVDDFVKSL